MGVLSISMPRGDLRKVKFSVKEGDIDRSDLITEIYMTVKRSPRSENYIFQKRMSTGEIVLGADEYFHFSILPEDTDRMDYGTYDFDIQLIGDDIKQTFMGKLNITEEVTFASNE